MTKQIIKDKWIQIRVTNSEKKAIQSKAKSLDRSVADFLLESTSRVNVWTASNKKMASERIREIRRIGINLNQIAKWCNQYKSSADSLEVLIQLIAIEQSLHQLVLFNLKIKTSSISAHSLIDTDAP